MCTTSTIGATVNITFVGIACTIRGNFSYDQGLHQVYLDGAPTQIAFTFADYNDTSSTANQTVYSSPKVCVSLVYFQKSLICLQLPFGTHLVQMTNLGRVASKGGDNMLIDSVEIQVTDGTIPSASVAPILASASAATETPSFPTTTITGGFPTADLNSLGIYTRPRTSISVSSSNYPSYSYSDGISHGGSKQCAFAVHKS